MVPLLWRNLPTDILSLIDIFLNTEVDTLHLRSVCSSWRSSVRPRLRPSPFPLKLPPLIRDVISKGGHFFLNYTTLYHLSPPKHGPHAGDPSDGWLFRVLEVNTNRFSVLVPLVPNKVEFPPVAIPKSLNLLDYRMSEVCRSYCLQFIHGKEIGFDARKGIANVVGVVMKVIVLWNHAVGCEFVVLVLMEDGSMRYWRFGDEDWSTIDTKNYVFTDMILTKGKFYAISRQGVLVSLDSSLNMTLVDFPHLPASYVENDNYLVEYKSDLYVFTKILEYPSDLEEGEEEDLSEIPLRLEIFKKCKDWQCVRCLGNGVFVSSDDFSIGLSVEDFRGLKGNCVYMAHSDQAYTMSYGPDILYGVFDLDIGRTTTSIMKMNQPHALLYRPPPRWLMSSS